MINHVIFYLNFSIFCEHLRECLFVGKSKSSKAGLTSSINLLRSVRTHKGPRQEVVLNMGELNLPQEQWQALAGTIEAKLNNQSTFAFEETSAEVENLAGHFAQMILSKRLNEQCATERAKSRKSA